ncbi:MAG TPA: hypothetical protein VF594_00480, partial [Rubricoccaceae bacterium]
DAPLPGIGTLARAHVSARIAVGPGGERVLMPPGEAVRLLPRTSDPTDLAQAFARHIGAPPEAAAPALRDAVDQLDARLAITGDARLGTIGAFQRTSSGIRFAAAPEILAAVNRAYEGLAPVPVAAEAPPAPRPVAPPPPAAPAPVPPAPTGPDEPPGAVDILLDLIVNEPAEATPPPSPAQSAFVEEADAPAPVQAEAPPSEAEPPPRLAPPPADSAAEILVDEPADAPVDVAADVPEHDALADPDVATADEPEATTAEVPNETTEAEETPRDQFVLTAEAADWHPAPLAGHAGETAAQPLDHPADDIEDAEVLDASPDLPLAAFDAAVSAGAAPPSAPEPPPLPAPEVTAETDGSADPDPAPTVHAHEALPPAPAVTPDAVRPEHRAWAFLYAAVVLGLSALVLYWFIDEQRPRIPAPASVPAVQSAMPAGSAAAPRAPDVPALSSDTLTPSPERLR